MSIIGQAKEVADTVVDKVKDKALSDDFFADFILEETHTTKRSIFMGSWGRGGRIIVSAI